MCVLTNTNILGEVNFTPQTAMNFALPNQQTNQSGPRPINLRSDARQVLQLLETVFSSSLDAKNRRRLHNSLALVSQPWAQPFMIPIGFLPGFVWSENGQIVGNVSIMRSKNPRRYLIANVAVHPNWQRQGIARHLMHLAIDHVEQIGGSSLLLQVKNSNTAAIHLYDSLQFRTIGTITSWYVHPAEMRDTLTTNSSPPIHLLKRKEWKAAYELDTSSVHPDLNWPDPIPVDTYKVGLWRWLENIFSGRQEEYWVTHNSHDQLTSVAGILSQWGKTHLVTIRIAASYRGQLERHMLSKILRRLAYLPYRRTRIDHPANDELMNQLLVASNFKPKRSLTTMRLDL